MNARMGFHYVIQIAFKKQHSTVCKGLSQLSYFILTPAPMEPGRGKFEDQLYSPYHTWHLWPTHTHIKQHAHRENIQSLIIQRHWWFFCFRQWLLFKCYSHLEYSLKDMRQVMSPEHLAIDIQGLFCHSGMCIYFWRENFILCRFYLSKWEWLQC